MYTNCQADKLPISQESQGPISTPNGKPRLRWRPPPSPRAWKSPTLAPAALEGGLEIADPRKFTTRFVEARRVSEGLEIPDTRKSTTRFVEARRVSKGLGIASSRIALAPSGPRPLEGRSVRARPVRD